MSGRWSFEEAQAAARRASELQYAAEVAMREAAKEAARTDEAYRVALALEIVRQHRDDGVAWSAAADLARGNPEVAHLRYLRDVAEGVREAMLQAAWRRTADRKDTQRFLEWSMRRELAEGGTPAPGEDDGFEVIGRRRT